jgi:hypothetical protein
MSAQPQNVLFGGDSEVPPRRRHAVFISDFVHLRRPFDQVAAKLLDPDAEWLTTADRSARRQRFNLTIGAARRSGSSVIVPMRWEPQNLEHLLPVLEADMDLSSLDDGQCRLSISGRYSIPLAQIGVGIALDRLGMHRVAEMAVRRFLSAMAETLKGNDRSS